MEEPLVIELEPLRAAGPVVLGSPREEAGRALRAWGEPVEYAPYPGALPLDWRLTGRGVDAFVHCGSGGTVRTVEVFCDNDVRPAARVLLFGVDLFAVPAEEVAAGLRERFELGDDESGLTVPALSVGLSRPHSDWSSFASVLLAGPGYYVPPGRSGDP